MYSAAMDSKHKACILSRSVQRSNPYPVSLTCRTALEEDGVGRHNLSPPHNLSARCACNLCTCRACQVEAQFITSAREIMTPCKMGLIGRNRRQLFGVFFSRLVFVCSLLLSGPTAMILFGADLLRRDHKGSGIVVMIKTIRWARRMARCPVGIVY